MASGSISCACRSSVTLACTAEAARIPFIHGYDTSKNDNYIRFQGKFQDEKAIVITVSDNGMGMNEDEIQNLNRQLREPIAAEKKATGLKTSISGCGCSMATTAD